MHIGLIGGTGAGLFSPLGDSGCIVEQVEVQTAFAIDPVVITEWQAHGHRVLFIPRHGPNAQTPPHKVNYRAHIAALKQAGVEQIIALNAVGGITAAGGAPGTLTIPDQYIDYTYGREHTFYDGHQMQHCADLGLSESLQHVECNRPLDAVLRSALLQAAVTAGIAVSAAGTCAVMQGPRLETAAEINKLERDGCDVVGMTLAPEAGLAAEAGLPYACIAGVVNCAAGRAPIDGEGQQQSIHEQLDEWVAACMTQSHALLQAYLQHLPG